MDESFDEVFTGLSMYYRDTTLPEALISNYKPGQIIKERGFTDMSALGGGMNTNLRYLIATKRAKDLSSFNDESAYTGHVILPSGAFFKVLDIYKVGDHTQVLLLEMPEEVIHLVSNTPSEKAAQLIAQARQDLDILLTFPPEPALQTTEWKERTSFAIGMDEQGGFFYSSPQSKEGDDRKEES